MVATSHTPHFSWRADPESSAIVSVLQERLGHVSGAEALRQAVAALPAKLTTAQIQAVIATEAAVGDEGRMTHIVLDDAGAARLYALCTNHRLTKAGLMRYAVRSLATQTGGAVAVAG